MPLPDHSTFAFIYGSRRPRLLAFSSGRACGACSMRGSVALHRQACDSCSFVPGVHVEDIFDAVDLSAQTHCAHLEIKSGTEKADILILSRKRSLVARWRFLIKRVILLTKRAPFLTKRATLPTKRATRRPKHRKNPLGLCVLEAASCRALLSQTVHTMSC